MSTDICTTVASIKTASVHYNFGALTCSPSVHASSHWPFFFIRFGTRVFPALLVISIKDPTLVKKSVRSPSLCMRGVWKSSHWLPLCCPIASFPFNSDVYCCSLFIPPKRLFHDIRAASVEASCPRHDTQKVRPTWRTDTWLWSTGINGSHSDILTAAAAQWCFLRDVSFWLSFIAIA